MLIFLAIWKQKILQFVKQHFFFVLPILYELLKLLAWQTNIFISFSNSNRFYNSWPQNPYICLEILDAYKIYNAL